MTGLVHHYGLVALFVVVMLESGGAPLPGETALIAAAIFAADGHLNIAEVIAVAAVAALVGDNIGYLLWGPRGPPGPPGAGAAQSSGERRLPPGRGRFPWRRRASRLLSPFL